MDLKTSLKFKGKGKDVSNDNDDELEKVLGIVAKSSVFRHFS